jgi:hypothetical protein
MQLTLLSGAVLPHNGGARSLPRRQSKPRKPCRSSLGTLCVLIIYRTKIVRTSALQASLIAYTQAASMAAFGRFLHAPMATSKSPTYGHPNSPRQDRRNCNAVARGWLVRPPLRLPVSPTPITHVVKSRGPSLDAQGRALLEEDLRSPCTEEITDLPESPANVVEFWTVGRRRPSHSGDWPTSMRSHFPPGILAPRPVSLRHSCSWA